MKGSAKAAGRSKDEAAGSPEGAASEDDRRIRALILAELDRRDVRPVARRTLALIAEGFVEPAEGVPGYRIVDRAGAVRLRGEGQGAGGPLTLHDLVEELGAQHAPLFLPPAPEPEPEPARDTIADVRAAGARFVETQSALARSLATTSAERSRALASAASETVEGWRSRLATRLKAQARPAPDSTALGPEPGPGAAERLAEARARFGQGWQRVAGGFQPRRTAARLRHLAEDAMAVGSHRPVALLAFGALAGAGLVAALSLSGSRTEDTPAPAPRSAETPTPPVAAGAPASNRAASNETPSDAPPADAPPADAPGTNADAERQPEPDPPRKGSNALTGVPEVIDTATLRVGGKVVRLFGVEWVRGGQADELSKYLRKRTVSCQPAAGSSAFVCTVEGRDLSEVVLFNGGGRASSEATPDLVAAEDHARTERLGVWKR